MTTTHFDVNAARKRFSSLQDGFVYLDAPGGSQVPDEVGQATATALREASGNLGAPYATGERVEGLRNLDDGYIQPVYEKWGGPELLDGKRIVRPRESIEWTRKLVSGAGLFAGISSGAALAGAARVADRISGGVIVFVICDGGWKYLSTGAYSGSLQQAAERLEGQLWA